jgi:hypothetical protein
MLRNSQEHAIQRAATTAYAYAKQDRERESKCACIYRKRRCLSSDRSIKSETESCVEIPQNATQTLLRLLRGLIERE